MPDGWNDGRARRCFFDVTSALWAEIYKEIEIEIAEKVEEDKDGAIGMILREWVEKYRRELGGDSDALNVGLMVME